MACLQKPVGQIAADESGGAGYECSQIFTFL
jgi:hypothetical protein